MSKVVTNYQTGVKYSFRPHGLKSKFLIAAASFVTALGSAFAFGGPADASVPAGGSAVTVCGNNTTWYVNSDETSRAPLATADGLVFSPSDLIHQAVSLPLSSLQPGSFVAAPAPDQPSFFSVEVVDTNSNYGTLRWDGTNWSIVIGAGGSATAGTFTGPDPVALLTGKETKWGTAAFDTTKTTVISFGVGYTLNPPGTVTTLVKKVSFNGTDYTLSCPAPTVTVTVSVPGPTTVVTHDQFITVQSTPTTTPNATPSSSPSASPTPAPVATASRSASPTMAPISNNSSSDYMLWLAIALVIVGGALLLALLIANIIKRRRSTQYRGAHAINNTDTQLIPAVDDEYGVSDYDPGAGYDPKLGGYPGANWALHSNELPPLHSDSDTVEIPPVSEEPPPGSDTGPLHDPR